MRDLISYGNLQLGDMKITTYNNFVKLYTDGSWKAEYNSGGCGCYFESNNPDINGLELNKTVHNSTSNRAELEAVIYGLESLKYRCNIIIYTDSRYVSRAFDDGKLADWMCNDWRMANGKPPKNVDLWKKLIEVMRPHDACFHWIKGHSDVEGNHIADNLAKSAMIAGKDEHVGKKVDRFRQKGHR